MLVETEQRNFTRTDLADFFISYREPNMASMVEDTRDLLAGLPPPQVEVFCTHGTQVTVQEREAVVEVESQVDTTERLVYPAGTFPPTQATLSLSRTEHKHGLKDKVNEDSARPPPALLPLPLQIWPWPAVPSLVKGDGDGTVNIRSLKVGEMF